MTCHLCSFLLFASRNQFASTPVQRPSIPAWQRASGTPASAGAGPSQAEALCNGVNGVNGSDVVAAGPSLSLSPVTPHGGMNNDASSSKALRQHGTGTGVAVPSTAEDETPAVSAEGAAAALDATTAAASAQDE